MSEVIEKTEKKKFDYTLRELCDEDLYPMAEIFGKVLTDDVKDKFIKTFTNKKEFEDDDKDAADEKFGANIAFFALQLILKNLKLVKDDVYSLLSDISGIPDEELRKAPIGTTPKMLKDLFSNIKNASFFEELSELLW